MAGLKKDVELIFRGEDRASATIKGVRDNVRDLSRAIADQVAAAERGEGTIDDLVKVYKRLKDAQGDVSEIVKLAAAYEKLSAQHAEQAAKAEEARQAEAALTAEVAKAENPTKRLTNQRDAATRKADAAAAKEVELAAAVKLAGESFEAAGGDLKNFEASQEAIRATALETARTLREAATAMDEYSVSAAKGAKVRAGMAETERFNALAADSGLPQAQINFISGLENRIEALSAAMKENRVSAEAMNREIADRSATEAAQRVRQAAAAYSEAADAADRLAAATQFKNQAASIAAGARDIERFGAVADTSATSARRLADTIQEIATPTQTAARTLDGLNDIVAKSEALFDGSKRRMSEYNASINDLQAAQAGMRDIARSIDDFEDQERALAGATAAMQQAQAEVLQLASAIQRAENPTQEMATELLRAEAALETSGAAVTKETTKLQQMSVALEAAGVDTRNLALAQTSLTGTATRAAAAQQRLSGVSRGQGGLFGLNPNELQNLGFQVNDIIVSIASGQNPLTVFIQQGAQIGQIWPGAFTKIAARLPVLALLAAALAPIIGAVAEFSEDARRLDEATANLASMGEVASGLDASKLAEFSEKLEEIGVKGEEAGAIMRDLMADGLNVGQMEQYISAAEAAAEVTGVEFKDALEQVRESFQGGFEDITALDEATNVFTNSEIALIEQLYEQGKADEARAVALEIYNNRMNETADQMDGPWKRAIDNLGTAWNRFMDFLADTTVLRVAADAVEYLGRVANYVTARLAGKSAEEARAEATGGPQRAPRVVRLPDANRQTAGGQRAIREQREALEAANATTAAEKRALAVRQARNAAISQGASNQEAENASRLAGATFDAQESARAGKRGDAAARRAESQRNREARAAEAQARKIAQMEEQLARQLEQIDSAVANKQEDSLEARLNGIDSQYAKLFRSLEEYSDQTNGRGMVGDRTIDQAREHVELQQQQLKNYETMAFREKELQNLLSERADKLDAIDDRIARGLITPEDGLAESEAVINNIAGRVSEMAASAIVFAEGLRGAVPSPQLDAFIAKMGAALQNNSGGQNVRENTERRQGAINTAEQQLNGIIQSRNALIEHENYLVELGLQTRAQAQGNIEAHYASTSELIRGQVTDILALAAAFRDSADPAMRLFYDNLAARMEAINLQTQPLDANFAKLKQGFDGVITSNIIGFIDALAQSFAALATGEDDVLGMLENIGRAFLEMIAKTLQGIAMLIIQMIILDTVENITGIPVGALLKLYGGTGVFHEGGVVGEAGGRSRQVSPLVFAAAPRYHSGGIAGLAPDEMGAILRKGEEVLTASDPRHRANGGAVPANDGGVTGIRNVLVIGDDEIAGAMAGQAGERTVMTHLRANRAELKQMVDN